MNINKIAGTDSPANSVSHAEARKSYLVGPPYIVTSPDMHWHKPERDVLTFLHKWNPPLPHHDPNYHRPYHAFNPFKYHPIPLAKSLTPVKNKFVPS